MRRHQSDMANQEVHFPYFCGRPDGLGSRLLNFMQARIRARALSRPLKCLWQPLPKTHKCAGSFTDLFSEQHHDEFISLNNGFGSWLREEGFNPATFPLDRAIRQGELRPGSSHLTALRSEFASLCIAKDLAEPIVEIRSQMAARCGDCMPGVHVRAGDVCENRSFWFPSRYLPLEFYEELFRHHLTERSHIYICSNNYNLVEKLRIKAEVVTIMDMIDIAGFRPIQQAFLEMFALSCCKTVYAPRASAFSMMAIVMGTPIHTDIAALILGASGLRLVELLVKSIHLEHHNTILGLLDQSKSLMDNASYKALLEYAIDPLPRADQLYRDLQERRNRL